MIEEGMKIRQSISQSTKGKGKRAQLRNHKQKLHDLKYDDPRDAEDECDEDDYKTDINLPSTSRQK